MATLDRRSWREEIMELPVFDTHTHLNMPEVPLPSQDFWDVVHYFWFQQELWSVGYPRHPQQLTEEERTDRFVAAFNASRNTAWNLIVRRIFADLYEINVTGEAEITREFVRKADAAVRWYHWQEGWSRDVIDKVNLRHLVVNHIRDADFPDLPGVAVAVPVWDEYATWAEKLTTADDPRAVGEAAQAAITQAVADLHAQGIRGMRVAAEPFEEPGKPAVRLAAPLNEALDQTDVPRWQAEAFLSHALFQALGEQGMFAQLFLGVERDVTPHTAMGVNDPRRIINLYPLFERYACDFELVVGAPQNNMDAAQAARIYPNVYVGGLWWYNFRSSTYRDTLQVRLEAVPAVKSAIVASDARQIEWAYGKVLLVKRLLADFLYAQIALGWLNREDALWVAREWLHDSPARRYT